MERVGVKMKLLAGYEEEYKRRHSEIWPELIQLFAETGISDYSIFLDQETLNLFGVLTVADPVKLDTLPSLAVMQSWWKHMSDIMETNPDSSPVSVPLTKVFYLP